MQSDRFLCTYFASHGTDKTLTVTKVVFEIPSFVAKQGCISHRLPRNAFHNVFFNSAASRFVTDINNGAAASLIFLAADSKIHTFFVFNVLKSFYKLKLVGWLREDGTPYLSEKLVAKYLKKFGRKTDKWKLRHAEP